MRRVAVGLITAAVVWGCQTKHEEPKPLPLDPSTVAPATATSASNAPNTPTANVEAGTVDLRAASAPKAHVTIAPATAKSVTDPDKVLATAQPRLARCYQMGLQNHPEQQASSAKLTLSVADDGHVTEVAMAETETMQPSTLTCVRLTMLQLGFTPPKKATSVVVHVAFAHATS